MDLSESVEVAFQATRHLAGTHIIQADILNAPLKPEVFDWVYSIGVLHHTQDPPGSFKSLSHFLKPGGFFFFWLYAKEGNGLYLTLFDPVRVHLTSHLPVWVNNIAAWVIAYISWPLVVTYACLQGVPFLHRWAIAYLPLYRYLLYFYTVGFWLWRNTILDKMIPEIAYHFSKAELLTWLDGFSLQSITFRNGNSWGVLIRKTGMPTKGLL
jgi:SAM-dependent methyltransferase